MSTNDGGPAFPQHVTIPPGHYYTGPPPSSGMSLRDWFAGMAMQYVTEDEVRSGINHIADICYRQADAMLAEREKKP